LKATLFALRSFGRELRSGEVLVLLAAVSLAVAALTAVGFLTDRIGKAVARQANEVLAADLRLRSQAPVPDEWREIAAEFNLQTADTMSFPSVVFHGDENATTIRCEVRYVSQTNCLASSVKSTGYPRPAKSGRTGRCWHAWAPMSEIGWTSVSCISGCRPS
jgi:putative ABC transport system permease protein